MQATDDFVTGRMSEHMLRNSLYARIVACAAGAAMIMPALPVIAAPQAGQQVRQGTDVVLVKGTLHGKLLSSNGKPVAGAVVAASKNGKVVAKTTTKQDGSYELSGLTSGTHTVSMADGQFPVRFWSKDAAPAAAKTQLTVSQTAVRGQFVEDCGCPVWGNIALGAIAITALTVAIVNISKVNDLEDKLDAQQSP